MITASQLLTQPKNLSFSSRIKRIPENEQDYDERYFRDCEDEILELEIGV